MRLVLLLLMAINLFASEFVFNKEFSKDVNTNILQMSLTISTTSKKDEKDVLAELSKFSDFMSSYKGAINYFGGNFEVYPLNVYKNDTNVFDGYQGNIYYMITSNDNNGIEKFLQDIQSYKKAPTTTYNINQISWSANPKVVQDAEEKLRDEAIIWTNKYIDELSKKLNKKCKLANIDFSSNVNVIGSISTKMTNEAIKIPDVQKPQYKASIYPTIKVECK